MLIDTDNSVPVMRHFGRVVGTTESGEFFLRVKPLSREDGSKLPIVIKDIYIPLRDIFEAHSKGALAETYPHLTQQDISLCAAYLATNVPDHPAYQKNNRSRRVKILFDENLPYALVAALTDELPNQSHIYLEGLDGVADEFIFYRPIYQLKPSLKGYDRKCAKRTKHIIITRDSDLSDLARAQWLNRMRATATPESIKFDDVNVVIRVTDETLTNIENAYRYRELAVEIMRAAYSGAAASYTINRAGVKPEAGNAKEQLLQVLSNEERILRARNDQLSTHEKEVGRSGRWRGYYPILTLQAP